MDLLSDALRSLRLTGGLFLDARFSAPWAIVTQLEQSEWKRLVSNPGQLVAYHVVLEGKMLISVGDNEPLEVNAGEIVLVPRNDPHRLASSPLLPAVNASDIGPARAPGVIGRLVYGGGGAPTRMVCGFLGTEARDNALLQSLPPVVKVDVRNCSAHDWVEASVRFAANELLNGELPTSSVIVRLSECLLAEAIRLHALLLDGKGSGIFRAFNDPQIGRSLALIHRDIGAELTLETLADAAALSRSAFVDRFTSLVGMPPIRYVASARIQAAKQRLRDTARGIRQIARECGYDSDEAFSRAFKREVGVSPARWRNEDATAGR